MLKRFDFFTRALVTHDGIALDARGLSPTQQSHEAFLSEDFTCCTGGGGRFALGDARGGVTLMGAIALKPRRFQLIESNEAISLVALVSDLLVVITRYSQARIFSLSSMGMGADEMPRLLNKLNTVSSARRKRGLPDSPPVTMAMNKDLTQFAIGYRDGSVMWYACRNLRSESSVDETVFWIIPQVEMSSVSTPTRPGSSFGSNVGGSLSNRCTLLGFAPDDRGLWVGCERKISFYGEDRKEVVLDTEEGCESECGSVAPDPNFIVVGRKDRVAFFNSETAGSCYSIQGDRDRLVTCKQHVVLVSSGETWRGLVRATTSSPLDVAPATSTPSSPDTQQNGKSPRQTIQVMDLGNKIIAHEFPLEREGMDRVLFIAGDDASGCVFVLTSKRRRLWRLQERSVESKLEDLLRRNLFSTAASLARTAGCDSAFVADIYRRYGDHLFEKGSFDDATMQYAQTLGWVEPSYVIRRFLDAPRVRNLKSYLEALHGIGPLAPSRATTATLIPTPEHTTLLLTCYAKLKMEKEIMDLCAKQDAKIDVDAALQVLKETGRLAPALDLARARGRDDWYVLTLLELSNESSLHHALAALEFIDRNQRVDMFRKVGNKLISLIPKESIECVRNWVLNRRICLVEDVLDCFVDRPEILEKLCLDAIESPSSTPSSLVFNTCLELSLCANHFDNAQRVLGHPKSFLDEASALALVRKFKYRRGELFLHEKAGRWKELLTCQMEDSGSETVESNPPNMIVGLAKTKLPSDSETWLRILRWLSSLPKSLDRDNAIKETLAHIEQYGDIVPPIMALRVLSEGSGGIHLGLVRPFLLSQMKRSLAQEEKDREEIAHLRQETERMREECKHLQNEPKVFNATTCCMTGAPLELPVVHFMSSNSYNLSSLPIASSSTSLEKLEDPKCANEQNGVLEISRGLAKRRAEVDEEFFSELQLATTAQHDQLGGGAETGFALVADYFGKCLFDDDD